MAMTQFEVRTKEENQFISITSQVKNAVRSSGVMDGICLVYVPHTTAGITINESADPAVVRDMLAVLYKMVPLRDNYSHMEGNSAAHIKTSLVGTSVQIPIVSKELFFGTWQGIFFCEFDGPRTRRVCIQIIGTS